MFAELDEIDTGILKLLQGDPRLSNKELSAKLNRSPNPIYKRVRRLEQAGYIKCYTTILDPKKIGKGLTIYTQIKLRQHSQQNLQEFMANVVKLAEVMECYHMTGDFDFFLKISVADMDEYNSLLMKELSNLPEVGTMESLFVMSEVKHTTIFPIL